VDALLHMGRYELGVIPDELQRPLVDNSEGTGRKHGVRLLGAVAAHRPALRDYAAFLAAHRRADAHLQPLLPATAAHRNLWKEPAARLLDPAHMFQPSDRHHRREAVYPLALDAPPARRRAALLEDSQRKKADQSAMRLWRINENHLLRLSSLPGGFGRVGVWYHGRHLHAHRA
jgi:hypothetical protein